MENEKYVVNGTSLENIRNKYEIIVIEAMKEFIPEFPEFDNCPICIEDVYALSLSRIPSTYISNDNLILNDEKPDESIQEIVKYAIYHVMSQPKHK
ncbi:MAG: late competence development ComFB family protein [Proteobacteria bacterium]|nr:late competence development ComFB family protein [Pseudomonadota bacterium]